MSAPELAAGDIVDDKYTIQALLRHSGPLATYRAIIAQDRQVALKFYDPRLGSCTDAVKALSRYEAITSKLPTTLVGHIVDGGEDPATGAFYTVTNFDPNPSLAELVEWSPLSASEMIAVVRNLARVLGEVHAHGISHLALKPTNLFVGPGPAHNVRVVDFGMSHVRSALSISRERGVSSFWLAPEQSTNPAIGGPAADVFATALIAFYALTGKSYWRSLQSPTPDDSGWELEVRGGRISVSQRARELSISLDRRFDAVFARALAVRPEERFRTVGQLAEALAAAAMDTATTTSVAPESITTELERVDPSSTSAVVLAPSLETDVDSAVGVPPPLTRISSSEAIAVSAQRSGLFRILWMTGMVAGAFIAGAVWASSGAKSSPAPAAAAMSSTEVPVSSARANVESENMASSTNEPQTPEAAPANGNTVHPPATVHPRKPRAPAPRKECGKLLLKPCE